VSLVDAIPLSIKQIGAARARGAASNSLYGQSLADIGQMIGQIPERERARRSMAIREQADQMRLAQAQREQAADLAIQNATSSAINPLDGTIDQAKFTQALAGTPAASQLPEILSGFNRLNASALRLKTAAISAQEAEDDALGAMAYAASQASDPEDQAAILTAGLSSAQKQNLLAPDKAKTLLSSILNDQGTPDPTNVRKVIGTLVSQSNQQRQMAATDAQKRASQMSADALADERDERRTGAAESRLRFNYASQLAATNSREEYARRFAGIDQAHRGYFDDPADWTPKSAQRAIEAIMDPAERLRLRHDLVTEANDTRRTAAADRTAAAAEKRANRTAAAAEDKPDPIEQQRYNRYKDFASQYEKARGEERQRATTSDPYATQRNIPQYLPPPSYEKWQQMTPAERSKVIAQPNSRIDDAELARRSGTAPPVTPAAPTGAAPAPASAPAAAGKTVTEAQLRQVAKLKGTSVDVQRERYRAGQYTIVP